jgi:hypothetical protein
MQEVKVIESLPNGLTKVDLGNDERRKALFGSGVLDDLARHLGCDCERCRLKGANQPGAEHGD